MQGEQAALLFHPAFLEHDVGHTIESPQRLSITMTYLASRGVLAHMRVVEPPPATVEEVSRVHDPLYIDAVKGLSDSGGGWADADTHISTGTYRAALLAAGAAVEASRGVVDGRFPGAFALVRPPGHHAGRFAARGFCIFNNLAVAAAWLLEEGGLERVAILDFDVHHGNGTQEAFYDDPRVQFVSFHRHPLYPGTGSASETGAGGSQGTTINVPLPGQTPPGEYLDRWRRVLGERVEPFRPEIILVSAGFDLYRFDPVAGMNFRIEDFRELGVSIRDLADRTCGGRVVSTLEGGYDLDALGPCVEAYLDGLGLAGRD